MHAGMSVHIHSLGCCLQSFVLKPVPGVSCEGSSEQGLTSPWTVNADADLHQTSIKLVEYRKAFFSRQYAIEEIQGEIEFINVEFYSKMPPEWFKWSAHAPRIVP